MRRDGFRVETLDIEIPFCEWNDGEFELMEELYLNYISNSANIERIKKFIITDYLSEPPHLNFLRNYRWGFRRKLTPSSLHFSSPTA